MHRYLHGFISRESPSAPNETTFIPRLLHSVKTYFHLFNMKSAENLLLVPKHAKQNAGTPLLSACAMYTKAYFAISAVLNDSSIASKETARKLSERGNPLSSHGSTNPTSLFVSLS